VSLKKPSDETGSSGGFSFPGNSMEEQQDAAPGIVKMPGHRWGIFKWPPGPIL